MAESTPPPCSDCGLHTLQPIEANEEPLLAPQDGAPARVFCAACGMSWRGTDAQVWLARRAQAARDLERLVAEKRAAESVEERELRRKLEAVKAGRWR